MVKKVVLNSMTSGFNIAKIQNNFEKIETALNDGVFWRKVPLASPENALQNDIDANGKRIINLPAPLSNTEPVRLGDLGDLVQAVQDVEEAVAEATIKASEAAVSAASASSSETNAANSETQAQNFSDLAASNSRLGIGTVTTVAPGTPASATITGAPGSQELSLVIPQGVQGIQGDPGPSGSSLWGDIPDKPSTFPPSAHSHAIADVTGLQGTLDAKLPSNFSALTADSSIDGTEIVALSGGFKATLSDIFAWFKTQANSWTARQTFKDVVETIFAITDGASVDINPANGSIQTWTLGANRTPTATNFVAGQAVTLMVADGTAYTITWSTIAVTWLTTDGNAPTLKTTGYTPIVLWKVGSTVYGR